MDKAKELGEWSTMVAPLVSRCEVASAFGGDVVWGPKGADALGKILKTMAELLDQVASAQVKSQ